MYMNHKVLFGIALFLASAFIAKCDVKALIDHNPEGNPQFKFKTVPQPVRHDAADRAYAKFTIVDGESDPNDSRLRALNDGRLPEDNDDAGNNFFFAQGTGGGRLKLDLRKLIDVKQINTYSWHSASRASQVYDLYAAAGVDAGFNPDPKRGTDPATCGWKLLAKVDTRATFATAGGQYGVSVFDDSGSLGKFQYLLFDVFKTEGDDNFGQTFFSEIDVRAVMPGEAETPAGLKTKPRVKDFEWTLDVSKSPELKDWAETKLETGSVRSVVSNMGGLPGQRRFHCAEEIHDYDQTDERRCPPTSDTDIVVSESWIKRQIAKPEWNEAVGSVIHELVHVVQHYGGQRNPGWMVEGVADYFRWFHYEPVEHRPRLPPKRAARARYSDSYQTTAGFLEYVARTHDHEFVVKMNAAMRQGRYSPDLWKRIHWHDRSGTLAPNIRQRRCPKTLPRLLNRQNRLKIKRRVPAACALIRKIFRKQSAKPLPMPLGCGSVIDCCVVPRRNHV